MSDTKPKRSWFRFQLSTAILLTAIIGTQLGLSLRGIGLRHRDFAEDEMFHNLPGDAEITQYRTLGCPVSFYEEVRYASKTSGIDSWRCFYWMELLIDLSIPSLIYTLSEYACRRKSPGSLLPARPENK